MASDPEPCFLCKGSGIVGYSAFRGAKPVMKPCHVCRAHEEPVPRRPLG